MTIQASLTGQRAAIQHAADLLDLLFCDRGAAFSVFELSEADDRWILEAFLDDVEPRAIEAQIRATLGDDPLLTTLAVVTVPERDWVAAGLEGLKPVRAGRFVVHGAHDRGRTGGGRIAIEIEAGQAFGSGHHGTTAGCLATLDRLLRRRSFANPLDLGTGSGVLAIALAKMLRAPVLASDIDPVSVRVATENAAKNHVGHLVWAIAANGLRHPAIQGRAPFDLIVANILAGPLIRLAPDIVGALAPGGMLVLSGLLPHQRERIVAAYGAQNVRLERAAIFDGWAVLVMSRP